MNFLAFHRALVKLLAFLCGAVLAVFQDGAGAGLNVHNVGGVDVFPRPQ